MSRKGSVFVVFGSAGEYSDHHYWSVVSYMNEEKAQDHAKRAQERCNEIFELRHSDSEDWWKIPDTDPRKHNEWDPKCDEDWSQPTYTVEEIEMGGKWPRPPTT